MVTSTQSTAPRIVTSKSGPLASYGAQYLDGLQIGLDYVTKGSGAIAGHKIQYDIKDDAGDPATGRAAENLGFVFQAVGRSLPAVARHLPDVPLPGQVVPQVPALEGDRRGLLPADEAGPLLLRRPEAGGFLDRRRRGIDHRNQRRLGGR